MGRELDPKLAVPAAVRKTQRVLRRLGVWYDIRSNANYARVRGCIEAAANRMRLGRRGVRLHDELKSYAGAAIVGGEHRRFLAHCRADRCFSLEKIRGALGADALPRMLSAAEIEALGMGMGLVNPFVPCGELDQVFDDELRCFLNLPGTMTTNAGDLSWTVEFHVGEVIDAMRAREGDGAVRVVEGAIAQRDESIVPARAWGAVEPFRIVILTGNAPESGMDLWAKVNRYVRDALGDRCLGDISMPSVIVHSLPELGLTMELEKRASHIWPYLEHAVRRACEQGTTLLAIACNTTPYFAPRIEEICDRHGTLFLSVAETLADWLEVNEVRELALVGIPCVAGLGPWSAYREAMKRFEVEALDDRTSENLAKLAYEVKQNGVSPLYLDKLRGIVGKDVRSRHVVLALTELSLLLALQKRAGKKVLIDPMDVYARAIAEQFLASNPPHDARRLRPSSIE
ncbi:MAG: aspartate/glutamate racemase family protein [Myxococcales bacterium]|nr:aspartate/glutamate racemase family protein [Myxococcales bacterium]